MGIIQVKYDADSGSYVELTDENENAAPSTESIAEITARASSMAAQFAAFTKGVPRHVYPPRGDETKPLLVTDFKEERFEAIVPLLRAFWELFSPVKNTFVPEQINPRQNVAEQISRSIYKFVKPLTVSAAAQLSKQNIDAYSRLKTALLLELTPDDHLLTNINGGTKVAFGLIDLAKNLLKEQPQLEEANLSATHLREIINSPYFIAIIMAISFGPPQKGANAPLVEIALGEREHLIEFDPKKVYLEKKEGRFQLKISPDTMRKIVTRYKAPNKIFGCPANEVKTETGKTEVYEYSKWLIQVANDHYVPLVAKDE